MMNKINQNLHAISNYLSNYKNNNENSSIHNSHDFKDKVCLSTTYIPVTEWIPTQLITLLDDVYEHLAYLIVYKPSVSVPIAPVASTKSKSKRLNNDNRQPPKPSVMISITQLRVLYTALELVWIWQYHSFFRHYYDYKKITSKDIMPSSMLLSSIMIQQIIDNFTSTSDISVIDACINGSRNSNLSHIDAICNGTLCLINIATFQLVSGMVLERNIERILSSLIFFLSCPTINSSDTKTNTSNHDYSNSDSSSSSFNTKSSLPLISIEWHEIFRMRMDYLCQGTYKSFIVSRLRVINQITACNRDSSSKTIKAVSTVSTANTSNTNRSISNNNATNATALSNTNTTTTTCDTATTTTTGVSDTSNVVAMKRTANEYFTQILMSSGGLEAVLMGYLEGVSEAPDSLTMLVLVAKLVTSPPSYMRSATTGTGTIGTGTGTDTNTNITTANDTTNTTTTDM